VARHFDNIKLAIALEEVRYLPTIATRTIVSLPITFTQRAG
jgi:hypothetical protein